MLKLCSTKRVLKRSGNISFFFIYSLTHGIFLEHGRFFIIICQRLVFNQNFDPFKPHALDYDMKMIVCRDSKLVQGYQL